MAIVWFSTKADNINNYENVSANSLSTMGSSNINDNSDCFNGTNYAEMLTFEEAIKTLYAVHHIKEDPRQYKSYQETIEGHYDEELDWEFRSIDNYRQFLSDNASCNKGEESLKAFICKINSDKDFLKSRTSIEWAKLDEHMPTFKFYYKITPIYCGSDICGAETTIYSWDILNDNEATFSISEGQEIAARYTFSRNNGLWYFTNYFEPDLY
jgi:hypothetical protein